MAKTLTRSEIEYQIKEFQQWVERGCRRRTSAEAAAHQARRGAQDTENWFRRQEQRGQNLGARFQAGIQQVMGNAERAEQIEFHRRAVKLLHRIDRAAASGITFSSKYVGKFANFLASAVRTLGAQLGISGSKQQSRRRNSAPSSIPSVRQARKTRDSKKKRRVRSSSPSSGKRGLFNRL